MINISSTSFCGGEEHQKFARHFPVKIGNRHIIIGIWLIPELRRPFLWVDPEGFMRGIVRLIQEPRAVAALAFDRSDALVGFDIKTLRVDWCGSPAQCRSSELKALKVSKNPGFAGPCMPFTYAAGRVIRRLFRWKSKTLSQRRNCGSRNRVNNGVVEVGVR